MQPICFFRQLQTYILLNYFVSFTVCFYCCQRRPLLIGLPATILEISVASEQRRGKLCHSISIQSTYFVRQLSVENVRVFIFVSVMPLYSSGGPSNMAVVGFSFPKIDAQFSPICEISAAVPSPLILKILFVR